MIRPKQYDIVELVEDVNGLPRGSRGTVVTLFGEASYYVQFNNGQRTFVMILGQSQIKVVESER